MKLFLGILFIVNITFAQWTINQRFPTQLGLVLDFGSHENEVGVEIKSSYIVGVTQWQCGGRLSYVLNSFGNRLKFYDSRFYFGASLLGGKKKPIIQIDPLLSCLSNNSEYKNSLGFTYLWYIDTKGTSQRSGAFGLTIHNWSIYLENDVFGGQSEDRYRTAHMVSTYRKDLVRFNFGLAIWTGESRGTPWLKNRPEFCKNGYKNLSSMPYGKTSAGILYGSIQYDQSGTPIKIKVGWDSEEIRHIFQNRMIHDLCWLPSWAPHNTPHYPRLNENGMPTFISKERRKDLLFLQVASGGILSE